MFDPYRKWLGIPEDQRPPTHYQLLGITPDEHDLDVIEAAVLRQSSFVRNFQAGQHAEEAARVLNEIAAARLCLVDRQKRAKYDAELRKQAPPTAAHPRAANSSPARYAEPGDRPLAAAAAPAARPAIDLDQLLAPPPRRAAGGGRRTSAAPTLTRRRTSQGQAGYIWQVPLLTVILIILMLLARTIGRTIAEQRAQYSKPAPANRAPAAPSAPLERLSPQEQPDGSAPPRSDER